MSGTITRTGRAIRWRSRLVLVLVPVLLLASSCRRSGGNERRERPSAAPAKTTKPPNRGADARPREVEVFEAVEQQKSREKHLCVPFKGRCFALVPAAPLMKIRNLRFEITAAQELVIFLSQQEQQELARITRRLAGQEKVRRLGLVFEGNILHVPKVRGEIKTDRIKVSFCDKTILDNFRKLEQ